MNTEQQEMAQKMMGEWALTFDIPDVVKVFKRYLGEYAPNLVATLNETAAEDYFTKALKYGHFRR
jgi:hypothetical protein